MPFVTGRYKKLNAWEVIQLSHVTIVDSTLALCDTSFVDRVKIVLNRSHMFVGQYGFPFLRVKIADIVKPDVF